ncbi:MAG: mechanosensitive ion channel family protein, partial [Atopobiaceae bacterium]|nr:mechanosensitive ion channel family protein [Atopobiaceae bacterium]
MDTWLKDFIATGGGREIVAAVVLLAITVVVAHYAVRLVRKLLSSDGAPLPSSSLIENIVRIAIWAVGGSFVL